MRVFKLSLIFFIAALFITACNRNQIEQSYEDGYQVAPTGAGFGYDEDDRWARENLDLQAVGELLQRADDAEEFEYLLNSDESGVNNLDLNGDGYTDYISVREFDDRYDDERGFSLFSMFGPEEIQEICTIIFDRDRYDGYNGYNDGYYPGARVLLTGNDQIYGDNYYYESNWLDRSLPIISWLFTDRDDYYRSPYYYENYPAYYEPYPVVETVVYQTRIQEYYPTPVFIQTTQPSITEVRIASPYREKSMDKIYSKLAKPTKEQVEFKKSNPKPPEFVRANKENREKSYSAKPDKRDNPNRFEKQEKVERQEKIRNERPQQMREKPNREERINVQRQNPVRVERQNQPRFERQNQPRFERQNQPRFERQSQPRFERQSQPRIERPNPVRVERPNVMRPQKQENRAQPNNGGGGNPNKGGGNGGGGGGGKKGKG